MSQKVIWKYEIHGRSEEQLQLPVNARLLSVIEQRGRLVLYAEVDPASATESMTIEVIGTGWQFDSDIPRHYIGTVKEGPFVWHVFKHI